MDVRDFSQCKGMSQSPSWTFMDVFKWKVIPERFGGGRKFARGFKDSWVINHRRLIKSAAMMNKLPPELLAGVCWIEVGGDPNVVDRYAFELRVIDHSGPDFIDKHFSIMPKPERTSFGFVSMQLRTAARTMGLDTDKMSVPEIRALSVCLEKDTYNINLAAMHLRQLANFDKLPDPLTPDDIRIIGARYNRGITSTLESIKKDSRYGDFIVRNWVYFNKLLWR
ncbi:hypothetical protein HF650_14530 [Kosakonia sp. SMBL-WEM22]|uniref:hypothetical protein n=1 Tax=Kosakonia sp. SMBL-WEM22 TaxID=2725560 RepID=UPI00165912F4|nr:hypothetical protein [Kosakonia sp. SMBL-WEM22]QNQ20884.1 hypothetical protein HF650_14530 [Kosakonia sp. SMBL-WEM22]